MAGVKRFHKYVYGRHFTLVTDHKPLLGLLTGDRQTLQVLSPCMTRWTVFLTAYAYSLVHQPGKHLCHADALSRCLLPTTVEDPAPATAILLIDAVQVPVTAADVTKHSARDMVISQVLD